MNKRKAIRDATYVVSFVFIASSILFFMAREEVGFLILSTGTILYALYGVMVHLED